MKLDYSFDREIPVAPLRRLLDQTDWAAGRSDEGIAQVLLLSIATLGVWDGDRLVAFCRAFGDDIYRAVIDDVVVDEPLRGTGIGRDMLQRMMARLEKVEEVSLGCEDHVKGFYERLGFRPVEWNILYLPERDR